jgi:hypothetical protein
LARAERLEPKPVAQVAQVRDEAGGSKSLKAHE